MRRVFFVGASIVTLGGCAQLNTVDYLNGPNLEPSVVDVDSSLQRQAEVADKFITYGVGNNPGALTTAQWKVAAHTGFNYIHEVCDNYLSTIEKLQRDKDAADKGLGAISIATTSVLTAAKATQALQYIAASLGLATAANDIAFERFLYGQDASLVKQKVDELMVAYEKTTDDQQIASRADLITVVRNDISYCTPAVIQANLAGAIKSSTPFVTAPNGASVVPAPVSPSNSGLNAKASLGGL